MQSLPAEDIFSLALQLPVRDIFSLCSSSREWFGLCQDQYLWKVLVARDFDVHSLPSHYRERISPSSERVVRSSPERVSPSSDLLASHSSSERISPSSERVLPSSGDWKSYYKDLSRFYSSFIYLVIVSGYSGQSPKDVEEEYRRLEQDHAYFVEKTGQPFVLVPSEPDYQISHDEVTFYFAIKPTKAGLTILDLQKMVDEWEEVLEEENEKASSEYIDYGYAAGYKIVHPRSG